MRVRTRFAPSPTGELHPGNVRIAILNWLYARHESGDFILRIEDTDVDRNVAGAEAEIEDSLRRLGLSWDEGPDVGGPMGPYRQSDRGELYREYAGRLSDMGRAFDCFCSAEELEARKLEASQGKQPTRYDERCRRLGAEEKARLVADGRKPAVRFKAPDGEIVVDDLTRGKITFEAAEIGDFVIMKSDGSPTYNFAVVVDDIAMRISHVIRGVGHLANTPRQVMVYQALELHPPIFVHVPHVLAPDGGALSKRHGAMSLREYLDRGVHPDAIVNYLSLLSWSSETGDEVLPPKRLIEEIDLARLGTSDVRFDPDKLMWLSGEYIRRMEPDELAARIEPYLDSEGYRHLMPQSTRVASAVQDRIDTFGQAREFLHQLAPPDPMRWSEEARAVLREHGSAALFDALGKALESLDEWSSESVMAAIRAAGKRLGVKGRALFMPLRAALTGDTAGPELAEVVEIQGRDTVLRALEQAARACEGDGNGHEA